MAEDNLISLNAVGTHKRVGSEIIERIISRPPGTFQLIHSLHSIANMRDKWREKAGFPGLKLHELRHTQATMPLDAGVDLKTVQHRLGHADAGLTLNTYSHALPANDERAAEIMGELMSRPAKSAQVLKLDRKAG